MVRSIDFFFCADPHDGLEETLPNRTGVYEHDVNAPGGAADQNGLSQYPAAAQAASSSSSSSSSSASHNSGGGVSTDGLRVRYRTVRLYYNGKELGDDWKSLLDENVRDGTQVTCQIPGGLDSLSNGAGSASQDVGSQIAKALAVGNQAAVAAAAAAAASAAASAAAAVRLSIARTPGSTSFFSP